MLAEAAQRERIRQRDAHRCLTRVHQIAAVEREGESDAVLADGGGLQGQPHPVGKADQAQAKARLGGVGDDRAGGAEIAVGEGQRAIVGGGCNGKRHGFGKGGAQAGLAAFRRQAALEADQRFLQRRGIGLDRLPHAFGGQRRRDPLERRELRLRGRRHALVACQREGCPDEHRMAARLRALDCVFGSGAQVGELFVKLGAGEAIGQRLVDLAHRGQHPLLPLAIGAADREAGDPRILEQIAGAVACPPERRVLAACEAGEAAVDDAIADPPHQIGVAVGDGVGLVAPCGKARQGHFLGQRRIDVDVGQALAGDVDRAGDRLGRGRGGRPAGKARADRRLDLLGRVVADHHQHGVGGHIGAAIKPADLRGGGAFERGDGADRQALGIARAGRDEGDIVLEIALLEARPVAPFGKDHPALALHRFGRDGEFARGLAHQHQRGIEQFLVIARQVEHVGDALEPGRGIGVRSEGQPLAFEQLDHLALGNARRAVEGHVFEIMRQAALVVVLGQRAGIDPHPHQRRALGRGVAADDVAHPVVEPPEHETGIDRHIAGLEGPDRGGRFGRRCGCGGRLLRCQRGGERKRGERQQQAGGKRAKAIVHDRQGIPDQRHQACQTSRKQRPVSPSLRSASPWTRACLPAGRAGWGRSSRFPRSPAPSSARSTARRYCRGCRTGSPWNCRTRPAGHCRARPFRG